MTDDGENSSEEQDRLRRTRAPRRARPPEVAVADIDRLFDGLRMIAPPPRIDAAWARGAQLTDANIVLNWLGLAPDGAVDRTLWNRVRLPGSRPEALSALARQAYAPIFDEVGDVATATREQLEEAFVTQYDLGDTRRYMRAFGAICRNAGISVPVLEGRAVTADPAPRARVVAVPAPKSVSTPKSASKPQPASKDAQTPGKREPTGDAGIILSITVPPEWSEDEIRERIAAVRRAVADLD
jgi:hypothetical protein